MIKGWLEMRRVGAAGDHRPGVSLPAQMQLVRAMRSALGHQDRSLTDMDLWGIVLSDPDGFKQLLDEQKESS